MKLKYSGLIKNDIEKIETNANFNTEQFEVFEELIKPTYGVSDTDTAVYLRLHMSKTKFYKIKKEIEKKAERILYN